jgi:hypothetical protein
VCRPSMNLPAIDHTSPHSKQWVTPELGLNSTGQGIPRLGRDNKKLHSTTGRISSKEPLMPTTHRLSFPTCLSHPRSVHLHCHTVHRLLHLPFWGFNNRSDQEFSELCSCYWTPSRRTHFLSTLSHLERVSHRPDNLLLLSTGLTTRFFTLSSTHGHGDGSNKNWTWGMILTGQYAGNPRVQVQRGYQFGLLQRFRVFQEFHNGVPGLLCACWVRWSIGVMDGQPGHNGQRKMVMVRMVRMVRTPPHKSACVLDDTWLSRSMFPPLGTRSSP